MVQAEPARASHAKWRSPDEIISLACAKRVFAVPFGPEEVGGGSLWSGFPSWNAFTRVPRTKSAEKRELIEVSVEN
jgi:hypothetical protein